MSSPNAAPRRRRLRTLAATLALAIGVASTTTACTPYRPVALVLCGWQATAWSTPPSQDDCTNSVKPLILAINGPDENNPTYPYGIQAWPVPLATVNGQPTNDATLRTPLIDGLIEQFGAFGQTEFYVVGHSLGGLAARYYLNHGVHRDQVRRYVSFGTGQYGGYKPGALGDPCTWGPFLGNEIGLQQLCSRSEFLYNLNGVLHGSTGSDVPNNVMYPWPASGPTYKDDTPNGIMPWANCGTQCRNDPGGHIEYTRITITPTDLAQDFDPPNLAPGIDFDAQELDGGNCDIIEAIPSLNHPDEPSNARVQELIRLALQGQCTGTPVYREWQQ